MFGKNKKNAGKRSKATNNTASKNRSAEAGAEVNSVRKASSTSRKTTKNCSR